MDRGKVIKELESLRDICNAKSNMAIGKGKVAWAGYANAADDAIAMLKEQKADKPIKPLMTDRAYIVSRTIENKISIAENNYQNPMLVTIEAMKEIIAILKEQQAEIERLKGIAKNGNGFH